MAQGRTFTQWTCGARSRWFFTFKHLIGIWTMRERARQTKYIWHCDIYGRSSVHGRWRRTKDGKIWRMKRKRWHRNCRHKSSLNGIQLFVNLCFRCTIRLSIVPSRMFSAFLQWRETTATLWIRTLDRTLICLRIENVDNCAYPFPMDFTQIQHWN